jgi:hypothetical protein
MKYITQSHIVNGDAHGHREVGRTFFSTDEAAPIAPNVSCIAVAVAIADEQAGRQPLLVPLRVASLAEHFARSTPEELIDAARTIGIDDIWDRMIVPLIS